jgi:hypothetical protein
VPATASGQRNITGFVAHEVETDGVASLQVVEKGSECFEGLIYESFVKVAVITESDFS